MRSGQDGSQSHYSYQLFSTRIELRQHAYRTLSVNPAISRENEKSEVAVVGNLLFRYKSVSLAFFPNFFSVTHEQINDCL